MGCRRDRVMGDFDRRHRSCGCNRVMGDYDRRHRSCGCNRVMGDFDRGRNKGRDSVRNIRDDKCLKCTIEIVSPERNHGKHCKCSRCGNNRGW